MQPAKNAKITRLENLPPYGALWKSDLSVIFSVDQVLYSAPRIYSAENGSVFGCQWIQQHSLVIFSVDQVLYSAPRIYSAENGSVFGCQWIQQHSLCIIIVQV